MRKILNILFLPTFLSFLTWLIFGIYYGWCDDIFFVQNAQGFLVGVPIYEALNYHKWLSAMYAFLYQCAPNIPWYGLFLFTFFLAACVTFFLFLSRLLVQLKTPPVFISIILTLFFWLLLAENLYLLTFTRVSILMMSSSLLCFVQGCLKGEWSKMFPLQFLFLGLLFVFGFLTRPEVVVFPSLIGLSLLVALGLAGKVNRQKSLTLVVALVLFVGVFQFLNARYLSEDEKKNNEQWSWVWSTLDGMNFNEVGLKSINSNPKDSIRFRAATNWFYHDEEQMGQHFFEKIGTNTVYSAESLAKWRKKLARVYQQARYGYSETYHEPLNWFWKGVFIILANLITFGYWAFKILKNRKPTKIIWANLLLHLTVLGGLLLTIMLLKMEDRVFTPTLILYTCCHLAFMVYQVPQIAVVFQFFSKYRIPLLVAAIFLTLFRMQGFWKVANENQALLKQKRALVEELQTSFEDKIIFFDYFSRFIVHDTPFRNVQLNDQNQYAIIWGQRGSFEFTPHKKYLQTICPSGRFMDFWDCIAARPDVVLLMPDFSAQLLEGYFQILYERDFYFKRVNPESVVKNIRYSFLWFPMKFSYFTLVKEKPLEMERPNPK